MLITSMTNNSSLNLPRKLQNKGQMYLFCKNPQHPSMFYCNNGITGKWKNYENSVSHKQRSVVCKTDYFKTKLSSYLISNFSPNFFADLKPGAEEIWHKSGTNFHSSKVITSEYPFPVINYKTCSIFSETKAPFYLH